MNRIVWNVGEQFSSIFERLINFIHKNFGFSVIVVFDGYRRLGSKSFERIRRSSFVVPSFDAVVEEDNFLTVTRDSFLGNSRNKQQFIDKFIRRLRALGIPYYEAEEDADADIVRIAIYVANNTHNSVVIVAEDIDILVLMVSLCPPDVDIFFYKMGPAVRINHPKIYSKNCLKPEFKNCKDYLLFLHAFTGCDTTSAFYGKGKIKFAKILCSRNDIQAAARIFQSKKNLQRMKSRLYNAGLKCVLTLYGAPENIDCLNEWRYLQYLQKAQKKTKINLARLPPTHSAAREHIKRVYYQVQAWQGRILSVPSRFGWWKQEPDVLVPVGTTLPATTEFVLENIFCYCKPGGNCGKICRCLNKNLKCSKLCDCRCSKNLKTANFTVESH